MAIYITGTRVNDQLNYSTGDSNAVRSDLGIADIVYTTGNQTISGIKTFVNQTNVSGLKFNVLSPEQVPDYQQGLVYYSDDNHTLNIYPDVSGLSLQVGQENWVRVKNNLSQTINIGSVVYLTGTNGNNPGFQLSIANSEAGSARTLGVVSNTMLPNNPGYVTTFGIVNGINTSSYTVGQTLYLSTSGSGQLSSLKPTAPNHMVRIGTVLTSKNDGSIFVTVQNGFEVDELHDASIVNPTSGDFFIFNQSGLWTNRKPSLSDLQQSSATTGQSPIWNGSAWVPTTPVTTGTAIQKNTSDVTPVNFIRVITQAEYDGIVPKDPNTLYFIKS
jgi:hypothetical protein